MDWATQEVQFDFQQGQDILLQNIQTASHAHLASSIKCFFPVDKGQCI
jgi:hypothetical protein